MEAARFRECQIATDYVEAFRMTGCRPGLCGIPTGIELPQLCLHTPLVWESFNQMTEPVHLRAAPPNGRRDALRRTGRRVCFVGHRDVALTCTAAGSGNVR